MRPVHLTRLDWLIVAAFLVSGAGLVRILPGLWAAEEPAGR